MIHSNQVNEWLKKFGVSEVDAQKMLDGGLSTIFDRLCTDVLDQVKLFVKDFKDNNDDGTWNTEKIQTVAKTVWEDSYSKFMSQKVYDLFVSVASNRLMPGLKEGHYRVPTMKDVLTGKSGDPLQDLMMTLLTEAGERKNE